MSSFMKIFVGAGMAAIVIILLIAVFMGKDANLGYLKEITSSSQEAGIKR
ncbi:MAG: hypothetical protein L3J28_08130 [Candidatus Polarisedimenticolaceae bacterium]|nr:hypothetical protein [Candidatus Polarisedimenticolaceae bacterium]